MERSAGGGTPHVRRLHGRRRRRWLRWGSRSGRRSTAARRRNWRRRRRGYQTPASPVCRGEGAASTGSDPSVLVAASAVVASARRAEKGLHRAPRPHPRRRSPTCARYGRWGRTGRLHRTPWAVPRRWRGLGRRRESESSGLFLQAENLPVMRRVLAVRSHLQRSRRFAAVDNAAPVAPKNLRCQYLRHGRPADMSRQHGTQQAAHSLVDHPTLRVKVLPVVNLAVKMLHVPHVLSERMTQRNQLVQHAPESPHVASVVIPDCSQSRATYTGTAESWRRLCRWRARV